MFFSLRKTGRRTGSCGLSRQVLQLPAFRSVHHLPWLCSMWLSSEMVRISTSKPGMSRSCWPSDHVPAKNIHFIALCPAARLPLGFSVKKQSNMAIFPEGPSLGLRVIHGKITLYYMDLPLLRGQFVCSLFFFLQTPAGFFQLGQGIRGWIGWHCGVLDEKMRRLDRVPKLRADPGVYSPRTFNGQRPGAFMGLLLPHPRRPWGRRTSDYVSSWSNQVCAHSTKGATGTQAHCLPS